jgi:aminopeptidase N
LYGTNDDPFIRGVRTYLKSHSLNTSTSGHLWEAISSAVGRNVGAWMHHWTYQKGYPLVLVHLGGVANRDVFVVQVMCPVSFAPHLTAFTHACYALHSLATAHSG